MISDKPKTLSPNHRPNYIYHTPLSVVPGVGPKIIEKLLNNFETEMNVIHIAGKDDIEAIVGEKIANNIVLAREGKLKVQEGGRRYIRKVNSLIALLNYYRSRF